ncbi:hypothetical protein Trydic_g3540 [Trypoxylus dichotomus]
MLLKVQVCICLPIIPKVHALIREVRRLNIQQIALLVDISKSPVRKIIPELGYREVSLKCIPKLLADQHKIQRIVRTTKRECTTISPNKKSRDDMEAWEFPNTEVQQSTKKDNSKYVLGYARHFAHTVFTTDNDNQQRYLMSNSRRTTSNLTSPDAYIWVMTEYAVFKRSPQTIGELKNTIRVFFIQLRQPLFNNDGRHETSLGSRVLNEKKHI